MSQISERIQRLKTKLNQVSTRYQALRSDNEQLKATLQSTRQELADKEARIAELTDENNRIRLAKSVVTASGDKAEMKFRVNEMVKEIDKCIALLNR